MSATAKKWIINIWRDAKEHKKSLVAVVLLYIQTNAIIYVQLTICGLAYYRESYSALFFAVCLPGLIIFLASNYLGNEIARIFGIQQRITPPGSIQKNTRIGNMMRFLKDGIRQAFHQHRVLPLSFAISGSLAVAFFQIHAGLTAYNRLFLYNHLIFDDSSSPVSDTVIKWWLLLSCTMIIWLAVNEIMLRCASFIRNGNK